MNLLKIQIVFSLLQFSFGLHQQENFKSTFPNCLTKSNQRKFDILPGTGWDNLANLEMGRILNLNFSQCSYDNEYLIPDQLSLTPNKVFRGKMFSEFFKHFSNYTSMTSRSVNLNVPGYFFPFRFGGWYSDENVRIKNDQIESNSIITRTQLRYTLYQSKFEPDTPLYPTFKNRIMDIAGLIVENKDSLYPEYLADEIIRDYGTHIIRSIDAGAILSKVDVLDSRYSQNFKVDSSLIKVLASAAFNKRFRIRTNSKSRIKSKEINNYNKGIIKTSIFTVGSIHFLSNISLQKWEESILDNLAPIDRKGEPIYNVLTPRVLPKLDYELIHKLRNLLKRAVLRYYTANTRKGCLNVRSPNFNPDANIDSGSCESPIVNFTFGGTYQTCSGPPDHCHKVIQKNPLTGSYSCSKRYETIRLYSGLNRCQQSCYKVLYIFTRCKQVCSNFETFWCYPKNFGDDSEGYQFGGIISGSMENCPPQYFSLKLGLNIYVCVIKDSYSNNQFAIAFGGLYSCKVGNPLAKKSVDYNNVEFTNVDDLPKHCPDGYVAHVASFERGCQISYCTETNKVSLGSNPRIHKPPLIELNFNPNSTSIEAFKINSKEMLIKNNEGHWEIEEIRQKRDQLYLNLIFVMSSIFIITGMVTVYALQSYYKKKYLAFEFDQF